MSKAAKQSVPLPPSPVPPDLCADLEAARSHAETMAKAAESARIRVLELETAIRQQLAAGAPAPVGWVARLKEVITKGRATPKWKDIALDLAEKTGQSKEAFEAWVHDHTPRSPDKVEVELEVHRQA